MRIVSRKTKCLMPKKRVEEEKCGDNLKNKKLEERKTRDKTGEKENTGGGGSPRKNTFLKSKKRTEEEKYGNNLKTKNTELERKNLI